MILRNIGIIILVSLLVSTTSGQFFVDWSDHMMDMIETPFVHGENLVIDARVYEYVDLSGIEKEANLRQLEEMVKRNDQKFIETIIKPTEVKPTEMKTNSNVENSLEHKNQHLHQHHTDSYRRPQTDMESSTISTPILILLILSPIVFSALLGVAICMIRRRRSLGRHEDDDEERLIKPREQAEPSELKRRLNNLGNSALLKPKNWVNIIKRCPVEKSRGGDKDVSPADEYQDLCRQRMESNTDKCSPISSTLCTNISQMNTPGLSGINTSTINSTPIRITNEAKSSSNSSDSERNSSWNEDSTKSFNIDIKTGHVILDFMEKHLMEKNLLNDEWKNLSEYVAEPNECEIGKTDENKTKNRSQDSIPYDHSRVKLNDDNNNNDYINASYIIDDDPKNASYIITQSPLSETIRDFWTMVWHNECTTIVTLCNSHEYDSGVCVKFWPDSALQVFGCFEIHLVSVHIWCDDYLIRNFLVKNLESNQSRAITQFHYLVWPTSGVPTPIKSILEFRRKVQKSHSNNCPIVVQCSDGIGRTGAYVLIDMVINKITKGAKEIDLSATLEYLRDQRANIVSKKYLYEYAFEAITEELKQLLE